ncbi:MAG: ribonuclease Z [Bacteroidaceae bacterium]|nr:ribonuclease Z [Bacteroidaceae bacterium]
MNFELNILGCGSAKPTTRHQPTSQILNVRGKFFMIDCGEGVQTQMQKMGLSMMNIGHIFISHNHGDHVFGLPGLVGTMDLLGRTAELHIHGPLQVGDFIDFLLKTFYTDIGYKLIFHPVDVHQHTLVYEDRSITVYSIPLQHRLPTCGYLFKEKPGLPHIRREMIDAFNIPVSQINNIKAGASWTTEDGTIIPHERLTTPAKPPRSYAYCSDTVYLPELKDILHGVTLLYHEATYMHERALRAEQTRHTTALQAATLARDAKVEQLCVGHFSASLKDENALLHEAQSVFPNTILANEGLVVSI